MPRPYQQPGLQISQEAPGDPVLVRALQRDLRALGYLGRGIDGAFGDGTRRALRSLQYDLLYNRGQSSGGDGNAPMAIADFNGLAQSGGGAAVTAINGVLDQDLAACIDRILTSPAITPLPESADPAAQNAAAMQAIRAMTGQPAPAPFIAAMVRQESGGQHFRVPTPSDHDSFITVGLDRNDRQQPDRITSRGYGIGQYTLFHHPPRAPEVQDIMLDPVRNVSKAFAELRQKFDRYVAGPDDHADDRAEEHALLPLRLCRFQPNDTRYMRDCAACAAAAGKLEVRRGTPAYAGASLRYQPDQYYPSASYSGVPNRADFLCDWPYAARRYNGSGNDSFHYQTRILLNLLQEQSGGKPT